MCMIWLPLSQWADLRYGCTETVRQLPAAVQRGEELQHPLQGVGVRQRLRLLLLCTQIVGHILTFLLQQQGGDVLVDDAAVVQTKGTVAMQKHNMKFRAGVKKKEDKNTKQKRSSSLPAVLGDDLRGDPPALQQHWNEIPLHFRLLTEHRLDGYLDEQQKYQAPVNNLPPPARQTWR